MRSLAVLVCISLIQHCRGHGGEVADESPPPVVSYENCSCTEASHCAPVTTSWPKDVFGFIRPVNFTKKKALYSRIAWHKLTTLVVTEVDEWLLPGMMCAVHEKGVRLALRVGGPTPSEGTDAWVNRTVADLIRLRVDAVSLRFDGAAPATTGFQDVIANFASSVRRTMPWLQIILELVGSRLTACPSCLNYTRISRSVDFIYLDTYSEVPLPPISGNNSSCLATGVGLKQTETFLQHLVDAGVPTGSIVLGVGWLAYDFVCLERREAECILRTCAAQEAVETGYAAAVSILHSARAVVVKGTALVVLETGAAMSSLSSEFSYEEPRTLKWHLVWLESGQGLKAKYQLALKRGLRGVGLYRIDYLDYESHGTPGIGPEILWNGVPDIKQGSSGGVGTGIAVLLLGILLILLL